MFVLVHLAAAMLAVPQEAAPPPQVERLLACRALTAPTERLACFDAAVGELETARRAGEVAVIDRTQIEQSRRESFGFSLPSMSRMLGVGPQAELEEIETTLVSASRAGGQGEWTFRLADGGTWRQIDSMSAVFRNRPGEPVRVRRGAIGSFLLTVGSSRAIRVRRQ